MVLPPQAKEQRARSRKRDESVVAAKNPPAKKTGAAAAKAEAVSYCVVARRNLRWFALTLTLLVVVAAIGWAVTGLPSEMRGPVFTGLGVVATGFVLLAGQQATQAGICMVDCLDTKPQPGCKEVRTRFPVSVTAWLRKLLEKTGGEDPE